MQNSPRPHRFARPLVGQPLRDSCREYFRPLVTDLLVRQFGRDLEEDELAWIERSLEDTISANALASTVDALRGGIEPEARAHRALLAAQAAGALRKVRRRLDAGDERDAVVTLIHALEDLVRAGQLVFDPDRMPHLYGLGMCADNPRRGRRYVYERLLLDLGVLDQTLEDLEKRGPVGELHALRTERQQVLEVVELLFLARELVIESGSDAAEGDGAFPRPRDEDEGVDAVLAFREGMVRRLQSPMVIDAAEVLG